MSCSRPKQLSITEFSLRPLSPTSPFKAARTVSLIAGLLFGALLVGCGGGGDDGNATGAEDNLQADEVSTGDDDSTAAGGETSAEPTEAEAVQATFFRFQELVLTSESEAALAMLTPSAKQWADDILVQTLDADEAALTESLPLSSGAAVTLFRAALPANEILDADDGVELLTKANDRGILASVLVLLPVGQVQIEGDEAFFLANGDQRSVRFERTGDDEWLIDLPFALESLLDNDEQSVMALFTGQGGDVSKADFYGLWVSGFGKTFDDVKQPLR